MVIQLDEVRKAKKRERMRQRYANMTPEQRERVAENGRRWRKKNPEKHREVCRKANRKRRERPEVIEKEKQYAKDNVEAGRERTRRWRAANTERARALDRKQYAANRERMIEKNRKYREANRKKMNELSRAWREKNPDYCRKWHQENKERLLARMKERRQTDPTYRMAVQARCRVARSLRDAGMKKSTRAIKLVGCNWETYRKWIESHFTDGMSWDNQDEWHVDHTYPVMPAIQQFGEAALPVIFNYRNCKPLWAKDNMSKGDKIPPDSEIHPWVKKKLAALAEEQSE